MRNASSKVIKISMILKSLIEAVRPLPVVSRNRSPEDAPNFTELAILENSGGLTNASNTTILLYVWQGYTLKDIRSFIFLLLGHIRKTIWCQLIS